MKKLSIFQIALLAIFGAFAVAGVLIFALAVGGGKSTAIGPVMIWGTLDAGAFSTVLRQMADDNPNLNQVSYVQKDAQTYESYLTEALASGQGPDLFVMTVDYAVKDAGKIAPTPFSSFSRSQFENTFADAASPFIGPDGIEAIPIAIDPLVLYWNKDRISSSGYAQPPAYWDQLFAMAQKLSMKDDAGSLVQSAIAFGEYQNVDHAKDILATLILQAGGPITAYDNAGRLQSALVPKGSSASSQATVSALRFFTEFADPSKDDYSWNRSLPQALSAFAAGDLALYVGYASEEAQIARMNPNLNFTLAPMPQIRGGERLLDTARVYGLAASKAGKNKNGARVVASTLASSVNAQALSTALHIPPARRDILEAGASAQIPSQILSAADVCKGSSVIVCSVQMARSWMDPDPLETDAIFRAMIEDTVSGAVLISEAVSRADQQLTHLLNQQQ